MPMPQELQEWKLSKCFDYLVLLEEKANYEAVISSISGNYYTASDSIVEVLS